MVITREQLETYFQYLDNLRESGVTNMYGGGPYLQDEYSLKRDSAVDILTSWMKTFDEALSVSVRADAALSILSS